MIISRLSIFMYVHIFDNVIENRQTLQKILHFGYYILYTFLYYEYSVKFCL